MTGRPAWAHHLALRELRRATGLVQTRFLALDDARVTRQEAGALERHAQVRVGLDERACDAVADGACLACGTSAVDADADVVGALGSGHLERGKREHAMR